MEQLIQMEQLDIKPYREEYLEKHGSICRICGKSRPKEDFVVDHQHKLKGQKNGENGAGMVRGVICFMCNSLEGKILSSFKRSGLKKDTDLVFVLRNLIDYLESGTTNFIHPSEKIKERKISKRQFNKIKKEYSKEFPKRKPLEFPKSGKKTVLLEKLSNEYNIKLYL